jgi:hypothetical protein
MNTTEVLAGRKVCKDESVDRKNGEVRRKRWQEKKWGVGQEGIADRMER